MHSERFCRFLSSKDLVPTVKNTYKAAIQAFGRKTCLFALGRVGSWSCLTKLVAPCLALDNCQPLIDLPPPSQVRGPIACFCARFCVVAHLCIPLSASFCLHLQMWRQTPQESRSLFTALVVSTLCLNNEVTMQSIPLPTSMPFHAGSRVDRRVGPALAAAGVERGPARVRVEPIQRDQHATRVRG